MLSVFYVQTADITLKCQVLRRWRYRWNNAEGTALMCRQIAKCIDIGRQCRKEDPKERPSISKIMSDLDEVDSANGRSSNPDDEESGDLKVKCYGGQILTIQALEAIFFLLQSVFLFHYTVHYQINCLLLFSPSQIISHFGFLDTLILLCI